MCLDKFLLTIKENSEVLDAMERELNSLKENVFNLVEDHGLCFM